MTGQVAPGVVGECARPVGTVGNLLLAAEMPAVQIKIDVIFYHNMFCRLNILFSLLPEAINLIKISSSENCRPECRSGAAEMIHNQLLGVTAFLGDSFFG